MAASRSDTSRPKCIIQKAINNSLERKRRWTWSVEFLLHEIMKWLIKDWNKAANNAWFPNKMHNVLPFLGQAFQNDKQFASPVVLNPTFLWHILIFSQGQKHFSVIFSFLSSPPTQYSDLFPDAQIPRKQINSFPKLRNSPSQSYFEEKSSFSPNLGVIIASEETVKTFAKFL